MNFSYLYSTIQFHHKLFHYVNPSFIFYHIYVLLFPVSILIMLNIISKRKRIKKCGVLGTDVYTSICVFPLPLPNILIYYAICESEARLNCRYVELTGDVLN